jgi:hypothetical protein
MYFFCAKQVGMLEAKYDIWRGHYEIRGYGLHYSFASPYVEDLNSYGIEYRPVAGCVVDDFIIDSVASYNATMKETIMRNLGINLDPNVPF